MLYADSKLVNAQLSLESNTKPCRHSLISVPDYTFELASDLNRDEDDDLRVISNRQTLPNGIVMPDGEDKEDDEDQAATETE